MKLLFFIHAVSGGGAERVMTMLMNAYANRGYEIVLATNIAKEPAYELDEKIKMVNLRDGISSVESNVLDKAKRYYKIIRNIRKIVCRENPNVVISFNTSLNHDVIMALIGIKIPIICSEHTNVLYNQGRKTMFFRKICYHFADAITVLTKHDYKLWKKHKNVVHMPNPVLLKEPIANLKRKKVVLAAGRLNMWKVKGFDTLIKCWARICNDFPDWELQIAGDGNKESIDYLNKLIIDSASSNVKLLGFCNNLHEIMSASEIFCMTSRREGLPMVLLEAMNAGCCCVSFDCVTGPSDIITNNVNGILVENQNEAKLQLALHSLMQSEEMRKQLTSESQKAISKFSIERICGRWDILFKKLLNR